MSNEIIPYFAGSNVVTESLAMPQIDSILQFRQGRNAFDIPPLHDDIHRVIVHHTGSLISVSSVSTDKFVNKFNTFLMAGDELILSLRSIVSWQKRRLDYQGIYAAYLLGALSEEEFEVESEAFESPIILRSPEEIAGEVNKFKAATDIDVSIADLADFLSVDPDKVADALMTQIDWVDKLQLER